MKQKKGYDKTMRFEFSTQEVKELCYLVRFTYKHVPKAASFKPVRIVIEDYLKTIIRKIFIYAEEILFENDKGILEHIWFKITGEHYPY